MYLFPHGIVFHKNTRQPASGVTGVATSRVDETVLETFDPITEQPASVVTTADGYYSPFKATEPIVMLTFGDIPLPLLSIEAMNGRADAELARLAAESAQAQAQAAATSAATSAQAAREAADAATAPTDTTVAGVVANPESETRAALRTAWAAHLKFRGAWASGVAYVVNDVITSPVNGVDAYFRTRIDHTSAGAGPTATTEWFELIGGGAPAGSSTPQVVALTFTEAQALASRPDGKRVWVLGGTEADTETATFLDWFTVEDVWDITAEATP